MKMIKLLSLIMIFSFTLVQCDSTEPGDTSVCPEAESYTLSNLTGLDGCTWVLVQGDRSFEPINLADFVEEPEQGQLVMMELMTRPDFASICLVGTIVEITCQQ